MTFSGWLRSGQRGLPRVTRLTGREGGAGTAWSVTVCQGPWGRCFIMGNLPPWFSPGSAPMGTSVLGLTADPPLVAHGSASAGLAHVVIARPGGATVQVRAVSAGDQKYFAFVVGKRVRALRWTATIARATRWEPGRVTVDA